MRLSLGLFELKYRRQHQSMAIIRWLVADLQRCPIGTGPSRTEIAECRLNPSTAPCSLRAITSVDPAVPGHPPVMPWDERGVDLEDHEALSPGILASTNVPHNFR
jgi:hypothetical protein